MDRLKRYVQQQCTPVHMLQLRTYYNYVIVYQVQYVRMYADSNSTTLYQRDSYPALIKSVMN